MGHCTLRPDVFGPKIFAFFSPNVFGPAITFYYSKFGLDVFIPNVFGPKVSGVWSLAQTSLAKMSLAQKNNGPKSHCPKCETATLLLFGFYYTAVAPRLQMVTR